MSVADKGCSGEREPTLTRVSFDLTCAAAVATDSVTRDMGCDCVTDGDKGCTGYFGLLDRKFKKDNMASWAMDPGQLACHAKILALGYNELTYTAYDLRPSLASMPRFHSWPVWQQS
ncbi:hypothetical protein MHYP_G00110320 [Metynnis hypsauchen]